jgi:hypothetical protein
MPTDIALKTPSFWSKNDNGEGVSTRAMPASSAIQSAPSTSRNA